MDDFSSSWQIFGSYQIGIGQSSISTSYE